MARLRSGFLSTTQTVVVGVLLAEIALLPALSRVALAYGPAPVPATTAPATAEPPVTAPPPTAVPAPGAPAEAPPPYPPPSSPPPGYPPAAAPPPGYPPAAAPPPAYRYPPRRAAYGFDAAAAAAEGERDAIAESSSAAWFMLGCLLGGIGVIIAFVAEPTPPPARFIGKSPEWIMAYSQAYKSAGRSSQGKSAIFGCLTIAAVFLALVAATASSMPE
jgi:hypothetical protein